MSNSLKKVWLPTTCLCLVAMGCSSFPGRSAALPLSFDTSFSAPKDWKVIEEGKWGLRLNVPPAVVDLGPVSKSLWIHEGANLRVIIDFGNPLSPESLKSKPNYSESRLHINGLPALVCSYEATNVAAGSLKKVVALFFLETRKGLGSPYEPSYRVEYDSDNERTTALEILQTVHFYDS